MKTSKFMQGSGFVILTGILSGIVCLSIVGGIIMYSNNKKAKTYTPDLTIDNGEDRIILVDYTRRTVGTVG